eukprot:scaffold648042_cov31-Prasinocladus_malaysianus.AAC.1
MHVVVDVAGQVEVDDVCHVGDVEAAGSHVGGHQHGGPARAEAAQGHLALLLGAVAVDAGGREAVPAQEVLQGVRPALGLHKDQ